MTSPIPGLLIRMFRLLNDLPLAFALMRREGPVSFLRRTAGYIRGERIPFKTANTGNATAKHLIFIADENNPLDYSLIPLFLEHVFGFETAPLIFRNYALAKSLISLQTLTYVNTSQEYSGHYRSFLNDLKIKGFTHAICSAGMHKRLQQTLQQAGIEVAIIPEDFVVTHGIYHNYPEFRKLDAYLDHLLNDLFQPGPTAPVTADGSIPEHLPQTLQKKDHIARVVVILHLYYTEMWDEINAFLANIPEPFDLFISLNQNVTKETSEKIRQAYPGSYLHIFENRGRDIAPFLEFLKLTEGYGYQYLCKIHTKKSPHFKNSAGTLWRSAALNELLGSAETVQRILNFFDTSAEMGLIAPRKFLFRYPSVLEFNRATVTHLAGVMGIQQPEILHFPAGSMFWCRTAALGKLTDPGIPAAAFLPEPCTLLARVDGTTAHAMERLIAACVLDAGYQITTTDKACKP